MAGGSGGGWVLGLALFCVLNALLPGSLPTAPNPGHAPWAVSCCVWGGVTRMGGKSIRQPLGMTAGCCSSVTWPRR